MSEPEIKLNPWKPEEGQDYFVHQLKRTDTPILVPCVEYATVAGKMQDTVVFKVQKAYLAFPTEEAARRCASRELAMRKLYRFAELLNPVGWTADREWWFGKGISMYRQPVPPGVVPFHSREVCEQAWDALTEEEKESLFWKASAPRNEETQL